MDYNLTPFNSARTIKGKCFVNFSIRVTDAGSGHGGACYYVVKIRKYSATTETEIANNRTREYITSVGADTGEHLISFEIDATETNFKIGDILRVTIEGWGKRSDASYPGGTFKYYTDPQNENGTGTIPTTFEVYMPFKLEV